MNQEVECLTNSTNVETSQEVGVAKEKNRVKKEKKPPRPPKEESEIVTPYYKNSNVAKLPKIPKGMLKDLDKMPSLTTEQMEKYLTGLILGVIPDKFGLEVGADTKIKAIAELTKLKQQSQFGISGSEEQVVIIDDIPDDNTI